MGGRSGGGSTVLAGTGTAEMPTNRFSFRFRPNLSVSGGFRRIVTYSMYVRTYVVVPPFDPEVPLSRCHSLMTTYSSIPSSLELTRRDSSNEPSTSHSLWLLAVIACAFSVGRYSVSLSAEDGAVDLPVLQLCQIHHSSRVSVIQTSRGEPSKQWKEVGCIHRETRLDVSSAAVMEVDVATVPFADRSPILGFGGAFTEAAALNYETLTEEGKHAVMELLFGREGLGYR